MRPEEISAQGGSKTDSNKHLDTHISEVRGSKEKLYLNIYINHFQRKSVFLN